MLSHLKTNSQRQKWLQVTGVGLNFVDQAYCSVFSHDSYLTSSNVHSSVTNLGAKNPPDSGKVGALLRMVMKIV